MRSSTPFGALSPKGVFPQNKGMTNKEKERQIQEGRREKLIAYIRANFPSDTNPKGNVTAFADAIGRRQPQIADVLDRRRSFGEKLARIFESLVAEKLVPQGKPPLRFDVGPEAIQTFYGVPLTREAVEVAADWVKLRGSMKQVIRDLMRTSMPSGQEPKKPSSSSPVKLHRRKGA
jgi:hypothetical protein